MEPATQSGPTGVVAELLDDPGKGLGVRLSGRLNSARFPYTARYLLADGDRGTLIRFVLSSQAELAKSVQRSLVQSGTSFSNDDILQLVTSLGQEHRDLRQDVLNQLVLQGKLKLGAFSEQEAVDLLATLDTKSATTMLAVQPHKVDLHEHTVATFIAATEAARQSASADPSYRLIWTTIRRAKLFEFEPDTLTALTGQFKTQLCFDHGAEYEIIDDEVTPTDDEAFGRLLIEESKNVAFPSRLPFDVCYFGYGPGVWAKSNAFIFRDKANAKFNTDEWTFLVKAHLISAEGNVWTVLEPHTRSGLPLGGVVFYREREKSEGFWSAPFSMTAWMVTWLIDYINSHRAIIEDRTTSMKYRRGFKAKAKKLRIKKALPPPYYVIPLEIGEIRPRTDGQRTHEIDWTYRRTRRGHERVYIRRGPLPLDPVKEQEMRERWDAIKAEDELNDYAIFTTRGVDGRAATAMAERHKKPKRPDEWVAVLYRWIDDTIVPKDRPDLPLRDDAVRRPSKPIKVKV